MRAEVAVGTVHPKARKMDLAGRLVEDLHGRDAALAAREEFDRRFSGTGGAVQAETYRLSPQDASPGAAVEDFSERGIADVLVVSGLAASKNIARQKIREGAVSTSADGQTWTKVESTADVLRVGPGDGVFLRMGKKFVRVTP